MGTGKLTVNQDQKTRKATTEKRFEKRVADILKVCGVFSYHTSERNFAGIPDRYVVGGNWIEFKVIPCSGNRKLTPARMFKTEQKRWLTKLDKQGDRTWGAIMFQPEGPPIIVILPWHEIEGEWDWNFIEKVGVIDVKNNVRDYIANLFNSNYERFSNGERYEQDHP